MVDWEAEGKVMPDFAKLENQQRQGAQQEGDLPNWAARQQKVFTNWINNKARTGGGRGEGDREGRSVGQGIGGGGGVSRVLLAFLSYFDR